MKGLRSESRCCVAALLGLLIASPAAGGGFGLFDMGVRRTAMGAAIARSGDPSAIVHNPAGMTALDGTRIYSSIGLAMLDVEFRLAPWDQSDRFLDESLDENGRYPTTTPDRAFSVIPMLAATHELLPDKLYLGASLYVANATGARFNEDDVTRYHLVDGFIVTPLATASAAYKPHPTLSIGASFGLMQIRIRGERNFFPIIEGTDASVILGRDSELKIEGQAWVPNWQIGTVWEPTPKIAIGAGLEGRQDATLKGPVEVIARPENGMSQTFTGSHRTKQLLPWSFKGGINVDVHPKLEVGADFRYWLYRQYKESRSDLEDLLFLTELVTEKNYRDSWQISGGIRVHDLAPIPSLELMLGGHYDRTPAPASTVTLDQPTFSHAAIHSGVRWSYSDLRLGLAYQRFWYDVPTVMDSVTSPPSNFEGSGTNNIVTLTFEGVFGSKK